jgi:hypothetical protein
MFSGTLMICHICSWSVLSLMDVGNLALTTDSRQYCCGHNIPFLSDTLQATSQMTSISMNTFDGLRNSCRMRVVSAAGYSLGRGR